MIRRYFYILIKKAEPVLGGLILHANYGIVKAQSRPLIFKQPLHHVFNVQYHGFAFALSTKDPLYFDGSLLHSIIDLLLLFLLHLSFQSVNTFPFLLNDLLQHEVSLDALKSATVSQEGLHAAPIQGGK
jgi:hypothetical protein